VLVVVVLAAACNADPGRDAQPMAPPLSASSPSEAPTAIIPLADVRKSQAAAVSQRVANTEITVTYSRPVARGRELFGALVPYGQVWNPGADQATAVIVSRDVTVSGRPLAAGKYSLWSIPGVERWTMIFSRAADVYHTPYPGEGQDALRLEIAPEAAPHADVLTFDFPAVEGKDAVLTLHWGSTAVPMAITVP
jgi:hypothetical protein